jgi:hypothetical protein
VAHPGHRLRRLQVRAGWPKPGSHLAFSYQPSENGSVPSPSRKQWPKISACARMLRSQMKNLVAAAYALRSSFGDQGLATFWLAPVSSKSRSSVGARSLRIGRGTQEYHSAIVGSSVGDTIEHAATCAGLICNQTNEPIHWPTRIWGFDITVARK